MTAYFNYLRKMLEAFFADLGTFLNTAFAKPWAKVPENFKHYNDILATYSASGDWGFWGWFFYVLFLLLLIGAIGGLCFLIYILIRKYVRFVKKELDKEELGRQIERLSYELYMAVQEKDKILNLKVGYLGLKPGELNKEDKEAVEEVQSRFPKLIHVDNQYRGVDTTIPEIPDLSLEELCNSFRNFAGSQLHLYYSIDVVRQLFAGIATSKLIILEGISGTGKTSLAYALGKFFSFDSSIIPVQPSWKDKSELVGYYNEFTKKFNETEFLRSLYVSTYRKDLNIIVLDEMNLARIEYYFAEFLSIMEMRDLTSWLLDMVPSQVEGDPAQFREGKLLIPQNVLFFGTANNDDSTFTISDKVYERAVSLFFDDKGRAFEAEEQEAIQMPYQQFRNLVDQAISQYPISQKMMEKFEQLDNFIIKKFKLAFGNRILKQLDTFIPTYVACGGSEIDGYDFIFTNKILKKFEALNLAFLKDELKELDTFLDKTYGKGTFPMAHKSIESMIKNN